MKEQYIRDTRNSYKTINDISFKLGSTTTSKVEANQIKAKYKRQGLFVRIIKVDNIKNFPTIYEIWYGFKFKR